jgi:hypothetical protein
MTNAGSAGSSVRREESVERLDLDSGARTLEKELFVRGTARCGGRRTDYPSALALAASCEGDPHGGSCVRGHDGTYFTVHTRAD